MENTFFKFPLSEKQTSNWNRKYKSFGVKADCKLVANRLTKENEMVFNVLRNLC